MSFEIKIDSKLFNEEVVLATISKMAAKVTVVEMNLSNDLYHLSLCINETFNEEELAGEINRRLIEQKLKDNVFEKTKDIRTLILANAFSKSSLIDY